MVKKRLDNKDKSNSKDQKSKIRFDSKFWMMIFIVVIFVFSMLGFALNMSPSKSGNLQEEKGLRMVYDNENNPVYIFKDKENYFSFSKNYGEYANLSVKQKALDILKKKSWNIYSGNFSSSDFVLKKALDYKKIFYQDLDNLECDEKSLVFSNQSVNGSCINIVGNSSLEVYSQIEELVFHIITN